MSFCRSLHVLSKATAFWLYRRRILSLWVFCSDLSLCRRLAHSQPYYLKAFIPLYLRRCNRRVFSSVVETSKTNVVAKSIIKHICESNDVQLAYEAGTAILNDCELKQNASDQSIQKQKSDFSSLLYVLHVDKDKSNFWKLFNRGVQLQIANESAFFLAMKLFAEKGDLQSVQHCHLLMRQSSIEPHVRSSAPLIYASVRAGDLLAARAYHTKIRAIDGFSVSHDMYKDILKACIDVRNESNNAEVSPFVEEVLEFLQESGSVSCSAMNSYLKLWFNDKFIPGVQVHEAKVNKSGNCLACKKALKEFRLTAAARLKLQQSMMALIKASIVEDHDRRLFDLKQKSKSKVKNAVKKTLSYMQTYSRIAQSSQTPGVDAKDDFGIDDSVFTDSDRNSITVLHKLKELKSVIAEHGPFDTVIDALNCGYLHNGFNSGQVRDVVAHFVKSKSKILVLCAGPLKETYLRSDVVAPADQLLHRLMKFLDDHCRLFFVGSSVVDDYYMLYALLHHNLDVALVSRDLFRDHLSKLDGPSAAAFQRWQASHQYMLKAFTKENQPVFKARLKYDKVIQRDGSGWHFPAEDDSCLCVRCLH